jgi:3'-phosphoadenosine 5'-phosphosulfate sulfotransferase
VREPLRVRLAEEEQAFALTRELAGVDGLEVAREDGGWQVTIADGGGDRVVLQVLDAVRRALTGQPTAYAMVLLDGREYQLQGE